ncbi:hypothetical protein [Chitinophaga sp. YIM B06452]|uniref:hypothetical protein n=1 Tax=Chitinophaga sp. YIM B06452 TaxID=3082158 RepID=UPI0031FE7141
MDSLQETLTASDNPQSLHNQQLSDYKVHLQQLVNKSQDTFEKQLSYISGGAIGASMLIVEKFYEKPWLTEWKLLLLMGWFLLVITLLINLISHLLAAKVLNQTIFDISNNHYDFIKAEKRGNKIQYLNLLSVLSLFVGTTLIIIFITYNSFFMTEPKPTQPSQPTREEKFGFVPEPPPKITPQSPPVSSPTPTKPNENKR